MGVTEDIANMYVELYQSINDGLLRPTQPRSAATTTPTSFEEWTKQVLLPIYHA